MTAETLKLLAAYLTIIAGTGAMILIAAAIWAILTGRIMR